MEDFEFCFVVANGHLAESEEGNLLTTYDQNLLAKFEDIFPEELCMGLPPSQSIQHQSDSIPPAAIPNRPHYWRAFLSVAIYGRA